MTRTPKPETMTIRLPVGALGGWDVLIRSLEKAAHDTGLTSTFGGLAEQIKAQLPKPEEPTGLGAVVEESSGRRWVRDFSCSPGTSAWYCRAIGARAIWGNLPAVKVLSPGVPA